MVIVSQVSRVISRVKPVDRSLFVNLMNKLELENAIEKNDTRDTSSVKHEMPETAMGIFAKESLSIPPLSTSARPLIRTFCPPPELFNHEISLCLTLLVTLLRLLLSKCYPPIVPLLSSDCPSVILRLSHFYPPIVLFS